MKGEDEGGRVRDFEYEHEKEHEHEEEEHEDEEGYRIRADTGEMTGMTEMTDKHNVQRLTNNQELRLVPKFPIWGRTLF